jgi:AAA family ATP:ADP antiporter
MMGLKSWEGNMTESSKSPGIVHKVLRLFTVIHPGEATTAILLTFNIYLLLMAYYIIKPVREALIIGGQGADIKSYLSAAIAVLLIFFVKAFSTTASYFPRQKLITWVTLFFISNLVLFYFLSFLDIPSSVMGIVFFIWVGVFNVMVIAQFWGFANDLYTPEAGKRLFPLVAFGATFGGFSGSTIAGWLVEPLGLYQMMLVAGVVLLFCIALTWIIHNREIRKPVPGEAEGTEAQAEKIKEKEKPLEKGGGFQLVFKKRYLLYIAVFVLLLNFINTNGEFILGNYVEETAHALAEAGQTGGLSIEEYIGKFYANFMKYFNLVAMVVQLFFVSRIFRWIGVRGALFVLPFLALGGYMTIAIGASLMLVFWVKVMENGTDYSLMNTTRHALFLILSREEKYKAKAAIDTFFHRGGDVLSALVVFLGLNFLAFNTSMFAAFNVVLCGAWIGFGILISKERKKLAASGSNDSL